MNRLSRAAVLVTVALGVLVRPVGTAPAVADNDVVAIPMVVVTITLVSIAVTNRIRKRLSS